MFLKYIPLKMQRLQKKRDNFFMGLTYYSVIKLVGGLIIPDQAGFRKEHLVSDDIQQLKEKHRKHPANS